jgi:exodeoxyribonuclease V beta subunit
MRLDLNQTQELNALTFPLRGSSLIEASAGTGKTYTIAALYVRLILGHGESQAFHQPLMPAQILVMTFTKAATQELIDRIQKRLINIAQALRQNTSDESDPFLQGLFDAYRTQDERNLAAWRLFEASNQMDEACVLTIDAWCQRVLKEYSILTGQRFEDELSTQESEIQIQALEDFWRLQVYPLSETNALALKSIWGKGFESLEALMEKHFKETSLLVNLQHEHIEEVKLSADQLGDLIDQWRESARAHHQGLSKNLLNELNLMKSWLLHEQEHSPNDWDGRRMRFDKSQACLNELIRWCDTSNSMSVSELDHKECLKLSSQGLLKMLRNGVIKQIPECFERFDRSIELLFNLKPLKKVVEDFVVNQIHAQIDLIKRQKRIFGFSDLLLRLFKGLQTKHAFELKEKIKQQYPAILIDEFQDTSPIQYSIFNEIYSIHSNDDQSLVCLIGDPKQSIYSFRGADVNIYIKAKEETRGRHFVLNKNFRSTHEVVKVVNALFESAESSPQGAFLYGPNEISPLPYVSVVANGVNEEFVHKGELAPVLKWNCDLTPKTNAEIVQQFSHLCAQQVFEWLNAPDAGFKQNSNIAMTQDNVAPIKPSDIAILVRTGAQAREVRRALSQRGIASVFMSDRDSVFKSQQAKDLLYWLKAVHRCLDATHLRAALASPMFGLSQVELRSLITQDDVFDGYAVLVRRLHDTWLDKGVFAMLRQTLFALSLPQRWLKSGEFGERCLTNVLHLAEILQNWTISIKTPQALINALSQAIVSDAGDIDEHILRLESEGEVVRVMTLHKSKGLEFPVVMMPFLGIFKKAKNNVDSSVSNSAAQTDPELERLREDLRLLYVGLTRAIHALWLGLGRTKGTQGKECTTHLSALGHLLSTDQKGFDTESLKLKLEEQLASDERVQLVFVTGHETFQEKYVGHETLTPKSAKIYVREFDESYKIASFSSLLRWHESQSTPFLSWDELTNDHSEMLQAENLGSQALTDSTQLQTSLAVDKSPSIWRFLPGGVDMGNWMHELLQCLVNESVTFDCIQNQDVRYLALIEPRIQNLCGWVSVEAMLKKYPVLSLALDKSFPKGVKESGEFVVLKAWIEQWLSGIYSTPLVNSYSLGQLKSNLAEMEFWLSIDSFESHAFVKACSNHVLPSLKREQLSIFDWHGMLMGFMDLVCCVEGRYWVLDYKTNQLGQQEQSYSPSNLALDVVQNHYDVQVGIYLLALHRHLKSRLKQDYDPAQHLGGAIVWYLRGVGQSGDGKLVLEASPGWMDELEKSLSLKKSSSANQELRPF